MWGPLGCKLVPQSAGFGLSTGNGKVRDEKPILDTFLILISVYQKGFCCAGSLLCLGKGFDRFTATAFSIYCRVASAFRVPFPFLWPSFKNIQLKVLHWVYIEVAKQSEFLLTVVTTRIAIRPLYLALQKLLSFGVKNDCHAGNTLPKSNWTVRVVFFFPLPPLIPFPLSLIF